MIVHLSGRPAQHRRGVCGVGVWWWLGAGVVGVVGGGGRGWVGFCVCGVVGAGGRWGDVGSWGSCFGVFFFLL